MSKDWKSFRNDRFEMFTGEREVNTKSAMKLVRNSQYSKSNDFKKLSVLARILNFFSKDTCSSQIMQFRSFLKW